MLLYILKSATCLAILLVFYKIFLERENMHTFKRFYLLGSLLAAFAIPFITFVAYVEIPEVTQIIEPSNSNVPLVSSVGQEQSPTKYLPSILWSIYGIGIVIFGFNFIKNLFKIIQRIQKNPKYKINRITNVLLLDHIIPHTFFNYIFLNKKKFEASEIPKEVLLHEETHALQKHSVDVLLVELLQVLFWFNPLIYLTKKAIKLNHEFLADKAVINNGVQPTLYQQILLEFSSNSTEPLLANAINYSSTRLTVFGKTFRFGLSAVGQVKKRFTVMKTKTSQKSIVLRTLFLLPLLAIILYGFSEKKIIERHAAVETSITSLEQLLIAENINLRITKKGEILDQNSVIIALGNLKSYLQKINTDLTKEQRSNIVRAVIMADTNAPMGVLKDVEAVLVNYGVAQINIVGPEKYASPIQEIAENINLRITKKGEILDQNSVIIALGNLKSYLQKINTDLTKEQRSNIVRAVIKPDEDAPTDVINKVEAILSEYGVAQIDIIGPVKYSKPRRQLIIQEGATNSQIKEYNALAKKYNAQPINERIIKKKEIERLEYIYNLMTAQQKKKAEPFPECPPPPPAPKAVKGAMSAISPRPPSAPKGIQGERSTIAPNTTVVHVGEVSDIPPPPTSSKAPSTYTGDEPNKRMVEASGKVKIDGETYFYIRERGETKYYTKYGNQVDKKGNIINPPTEKIEFIEVIEVPAAPKEPKKPKTPKVNKGEKSNIPPPPSPSDQNEVADKVIDEIIAHQDPYDNINSMQITSKPNKAVTPNNEETPVYRVAPPPTPPTPISPLDHAIEMAKKDATFYFEGKEISSDKAIDLLKKNKNLNIDSRGSKGKRPVVRISAQPIDIEN